MAESPLIEMIEALRVVTCAECGISYAVPTPLYLIAARDRKHTWCPAGHAWTPLAADADANALQTNIELTTRLADARMHLEAARKRILELSPLTAPSPEELRRRSHLLTERAESKEFGRVVCCFCGKLKSKARLAEHIRRRHRAELIEKPAMAFV